MSAQTQEENIKAKSFMNVEQSLGFIIGPGVNDLAWYVRLWKVLVKISDLSGCETNRIRYFHNLFGSYKDWPHSSSCT